MFDALQENGVLLGFRSIYHVSFFLLFAFYVTANANINLITWKDYARFCLHYPFFLAVSMGISLYNAVGVIEGYWGKKSDFIRTPKFNIVRKKGNWDGKDYVKREVNFITYLEVGCLALFTFGLGAAFYLQNYGAVPYFLMMTFGFGTVLYYSFWHSEKAQKAGDHDPQIQPKENQEAGISV